MMYAAEIAQKARSDERTPCPRGMGDGSVRLEPWRSSKLSILTAGVARRMHGFRHIQTYHVGLLSWVPPNHPGH